MTEQIVISSRFNGPPASGNGGYTCGAVAAFLDFEAEVTLRVPPPLDTPMRVRRDDDGNVSVFDGERLVAEARPVRMELEAPSPPGFEEAEAVARPADPHPFPTCFVCGPAREPGDGLRVFAGTMPSRSIVAAPWVPAAGLAGDDGWVRPEFLWAAMDCPSWWAFDLLEPLRDVAMLGRMAARIAAPIRPGERCIVVTWPQGREGRKWQAGSALYGDDGSLRAAARVTWITLPRS